MWRIPVIKHVFRASLPSQDELAMQVWTIPGRSFVNTPPLPDAIFPAVDDLPLAVRASEVYIQHGLNRQGGSYRGSVQSISGQASVLLTTRHEPSAPECAASMGELPRPTALA